MVPPFADSISEGDVRWDKGMSLFQICYVLLLVLWSIQDDSWFTKFCDKPLKIFKVLKLKYILP